MTPIIKDKDPILEQKFFEFLFPLAFPDYYTDPVIVDFCRKELSGNALLPAGSLLEMAISVRKCITRHPTIGRDFVDGSDAKSASVRWASNGKCYGAPIHDIYNKKGLLRCVVYERLHDKFYFFLIPHAAYCNIPKTSNIEIPFNLDGSPRRNPTAKNLRNVDWWQFEVTSFDDILHDTAPSFEFASDVRKRLAVESQNLKKNSLRIKRSIVSTKSHPKLQTPSPCKKLTLLPQV